MEQMKKAVFLFRRDLRLEDNLGLLEVLENATTVIPAFIFDPRQVDRDKNEYFSEPAFHFLLQSLQELDDTLKNRGSKLFVYHGDPATVVKSLIEKDGIDGVCMNKDYTPFARKRDKAISDVCDEYGVAFNRFDDCALSKIEDVRTNQENIYTVFTPFMKKVAAEETVPEPRRNNFDNFYTGSSETATVSLSDYEADIDQYELTLNGGREEGLRLLRENDYLKDYKDTRNLPAQRGTSRLSAHHKFGTISIRETYHMTKESKNNTDSFISELYWRDFYLYIAYHFPRVFEESFLDWAKNIEWENDEEQFTSWCEGKTGVPMVDAAMRELNNTGWMHNRSRMIVASYLTKNLLVDWRWGEKYFAKHLIDYDPSQNNGGWQWSASTGADPRPIRVFNPYTQATKYDPDAEYIKKWIPELADVDDSVLTDGKTQNFSELGEDYPAPLIDQKESYHRAMDTYKKAKN
jgi:deoxyribodipyrimidine photo-lyase